jgi:hypothetical protein
MVLGLVVYNSKLSAHCEAPRLQCLDFLGATLFISSIIPTLVGLSLATSICDWTSWQAISMLTLGGISLLISVGRELCPTRFSRASGGNAAPTPTFLDLRTFEPVWALMTWSGALVLGFVVSNLHVLVSVLTQRRCMLSCSYFPSIFL